MVYQRRAAILELETRYDNAMAEYVLEIREPGVPSRIERFVDADGFRARLHVIEHNLIADHWRPSGAPLMLPEGWPDRKPPR